MMLSGSPVSGFLISTNAFLIPTAAASRLHSLASLPLILSGWPSPPPSGALRNVSIFLISFCRLFVIALPHSPQATATHTCQQQQQQQQLLAIWRNGGGSGKGRGKLARNEWLKPSADGLLQRHLFGRTSDAFNGWPWPDFNASAYWIRLQLQLHMQLKLEGWQQKHSSIQFYLEL